MEAVLSVLSEANGLIFNEKPAGHGWLLGIGLGAFYLCVLYMLWGLFNSFRTRDVWQFINPIEKLVHGAAIVACACIPIMVCRYFTKSSCDMRSTRRPFGRTRCLTCLWGRASCSVLVFALNCDATSVSISTTIQLHPKNRPSLILSGISFCCYRRRCGFLGVFLNISSRLTK